VRIVALLTRIEKVYKSVNSISFSGQMLRFFIKPGPIFVILQAMTRLTIYLRIIGARLHQDDDLAGHFHQIAEGLLSAVHLAENYCKINPDAARQVALAHVYTLFYYKASGMFTSINWIWQQTADFFSKIDANLDRDTSDE
jgi:hypothetical protein